MGDEFPVPAELGTEEARGELYLVLEAVRRVLGGVAPTDAIRDLNHPRFDSYLLHCVQRQALRSAAFGSDPATLLNILRATDDVLSALGSNDVEDLHSRLMAPDAHELLVEVAHDLRSPLTSILFLSETLRVGHSGEVNPLQRSQLGLIYSAALGLVSVVGDVLEFGRGGRGLLEPEPIPFSISEVIRGLEEMVGPMAEAKRIELRLNLPSADRAFGHPAAVGRVLLNLTTNALKFTDEGFVEVGATPRPHGKMEYYVRDTGRGLDPSREDLFQPFKKASQREGHFFSGSGLGLSIVQRLVRGMGGGSLELESEAGRGTRFRFVVDSRPQRVSPDDTASSRSGT